MELVYEKQLGGGELRGVGYEEYMAVPTSEMIVLSDETSDGGNVTLLDGDRKVVYRGVGDDLDSLVKVWTLDTEEVCSMVAEIAKTRHMELLQEIGRLQAEAARLTRQTRQIASVLLDCILLPARPRGQTYE